MFNVTTSKPSKHVRLPYPNGEFKVKIKKNDDNELAILQALPDTGASIDCVEEKFV